MQWNCPSVIALGIGKDNSGTLTAGWYYCNAVEQRYKSNKDRKGVFEQPGSYDPNQDIKLQNYLDSV